MSEGDFTRGRVAWADVLRVGEHDVTAETVTELLATHLTDQRLVRLRDVVQARSLHFTAVLENIYDRGNVSAVMRSAEAFGFLRLSLVDLPGAKFKAANRITKGAEKWLDVRSFASPVEVIKDLREKGYQTWATDLDTDRTIDSIDWSKPTAVILGNEKAGVSGEMRGLVDGCFRLPMAGFSQSFNISVAAALIYYRAHLELRAHGNQLRLSPRQQTQLTANYLLRCFDNPAGLLSAHGVGHAHRT